MVDIKRILWDFIWNVMEGLMICVDEVKAAYVCDGNIIFACFMVVLSD